jgi:serine/threonine-protein kinase RsbT
MDEKHDGFTQRFEIIGGNFARAGSISTLVKEILQDVGIDSSIIRRAAIASYEAEMNVVMYADHGQFILEVDPQKITIAISDRGRGIADIALAMQEGYSTATDEMREMGFGAGLGLPNIKRNADRFEIDSNPGEGTTLRITFDLNRRKNA